VPPFIGLTAHHVHVKRAIQHFECLAWTTALQDTLPAYGQAGRIGIEWDRREHVFEHVSLVVGQNGGRHHGNRMNAAWLLNRHLCGDLCASMITEEIKGFE
jgi:hypothetical protein